jgi:hypothetical protein
MSGVVVVLVVATLILGTAISRKAAFLVAEETMQPYHGVSEYAYTKFRLLGYLDHLGPTWLFIYDSPDMFDAATFVIEVDILGRLRAVHAPKTGLWDDKAKTWVKTPTKKRIP